MKPSDKRFYAPLDGTVSTVFPTGHAIGITGDNGIEMLIHIGLDTVQLGGKGFHVFVKEGQQVKRGELLVECDLALLCEKGFQTITPVLVTNADDFSSVNVLKQGIVNMGEQIVEVERGRKENEE